MKPPKIAWVVVDSVGCMLAVRGSRADALDVTLHGEEIHRYALAAPKPRKRKKAKP